MFDCFVIQYCHIKVCTRYMVANLAFQKTVIATYLLESKPVYTNISFLLTVTSEINVRVSKYTDLGKLDNGFYSLSLSNCGSPDCDVAKPNPIPIVMTVSGLGWRLG